MKYLLLILLLFGGCKSSKTTVETSTFEKDSISTVSEIKYVQEPLKYTSTFDISKLKPFKQSFTNRGVTTTIEKDSASGKLKVTNEVKSDTLLRVKNSRDYFKSLSVKEKQEEIIRYVPNPLNWQLPLVLLIIIIILILHSKFNLVKVGKNLLFKLLGVRL